MISISDEFKSLVFEELNEYKDFLTEKDGELKLTIESPCKELGILTVSVRESEIILYIKNFHTHINSHSLKYEDVDSITLLAIDKIKKIIYGNFYFNETYSNSRLESPGAGPQRLSKEEKDLLVKIFGSGTYTKEWNWFGEIE